MTPTAEAPVFTTSQPNSSRQAHRGFLGGTFQPGLGLNDETSLSGSKSSVDGDVRFFHDVECCFCIIFKHACTHSLKRPPPLEYDECKTQPPYC